MKYFVLIETPVSFFSEYYNNITWCRNDDVRCGMGLLIKDSINFKVREDMCPHVYDWQISKWKMNVVRKKLLVSFIDPTHEHVLMYCCSILFDIMKVINSDGKLSFILGKVIYILFEMWN